MGAEQPQQSFTPVLIMSWMKVDDTLLHSQPEAVEGQHPGFSYPGWCVLVTRTLRPTGSSPRLSWSRRDGGTY